MGFLLSDSFGYLKNAICADQKQEVNGYFIGLKNLNCFYKMLTTRLIRNRKYSRPKP